jgi:hypothetical protein
MATLAHKPTPIETHVLDPLRIAIYGEGGVGKTTFALSFPFPLVIDTDGGLEGDAIARDDLIGEEWSPEGWQDLNGLLAYIKAKTEEKQYQTIVIDSLDTLCRFILHEAEALPTQGRKANASEDELVTATQQDYGKVANALDIFLGRLKILSRERGIHIVLTSAVRLPDPDKGRTKRTFDVQPAVEAIVQYWANVYGELVVEELPKEKGSKEMEEHRILWTKASDRARKNKTRWAALRPGITNPSYDKIVGLIEKGTAK